MTLIAARTVALFRDHDPAPRCDCGEPELMALRPGEDGVYAIARWPDVTEDIRLGLILVSRGQSGTAWCRACWVRRFGNGQRSGASGPG